MQNKDLAAAIRRGARETFKAMPTGGRHASKKKYTRKRKHAKGEA